MKKCTQLVMLILTTFCFAQQNFGDHVGKKDVKKGLISFETFTAENGDVSYGFRMDGLIVGPNMILHTDGKTTYVNYNKDHQKDGTLVEMNKQQGTIELYTYRKDQKDGPAFKIANGNIEWKKEFKKDKEDLRGHVVPPPGKYVLVKGDGKSGFTMEKDDKGYALGYFRYGYRQFPMIHVWNTGNSYYGQYLAGERKGFGVYFYKEGGKYVGMFDEGYFEGLGFTVDKDGNVTEKGYYDDGKLVTPM